MPNFLSRLGGPDPVTLATERTSREITLIYARGSLLAAQEVAKVEAIAEVAEAALLATSRVARLEAVLATHTPHAAGRLQFIAEAAALGTAGVVQQTGRKLL